MNLKVDSIFATAVQLQTQQERQQYLDSVRGGDTEMRQRLDALLQAHEDAGSFLANPAAQIDPVLYSDTSQILNHGETVQINRNLVPLNFLSPTNSPGSIGRVGDYEVVDVIGRGGMGVVLRAFDPKLTRTVAIKILAPEVAVDQQAEERFLAEARAVASITHNHVVTVFNVNESHRPPWIAMELVEGESLQQRLDRSGALPLAEVLRIGAQTAAGLAAAHQRGIVHRDIKPANILLELQQQSAKITDFGLARAVNDPNLTQNGLIAGTPQYMSPEQAQGWNVDARSDLFSLGCVFYYMASGRSPFAAESVGETLQRVCEESPQPILDWNPQLPVWFVAIIDRLLCKDPNERIQSAAELANTLGQCLAHVQQPHQVAPPQVVAAPVAPPSTVVKPVPVTAHANRSNKLAWTITAICLLLVVGVGAWAIHLATRTTPTDANATNQPTKGDDSSDDQSGGDVNLQLPFIKLRADRNGNVDLNAGGVRVKTGERGNVDVKAGGLRLKAGKKGSVDVKVKVGPLDPRG